MNKEDLILRQLVKIADKQQKIIQKLAQTVAENPSGDMNITPPAPMQDPNIEYLMGAIPVAATNVGINNVVVVSVEKQPGAQSNSGAIMDNSYMAQIKGIPVKQSNSFKQEWDKQLTAQKPDLVGHVGFYFID
jgi:peptide deformylase